ncbi:DUF3570 domain-containing protein [Porticoccus sp. W117]|uniref:DUF3570 domain-containing protein n=1 Tax=Porticoccus sp. W117 TaxID=3054777 RepID=UPI0025977887|nr:DUF3570 domain-containing protein [Porticoccus sp. W117]MDM3872177.1 DUF3570 domain-containing protein [Porticoccus sp. W117]
MLLALLSFSATAATLPEDRLDIMYHAYKGGGATIDGPSVLVRKKFADKISVRGNYYTDFVSSASIDVIATASAYEEERTEFSGGIDYLHNKTTMSLNVTSSSENDYDAQTVGFSISQDFFGDLTTLALGYSVGSDTVRRRDDDVFEEEVDRQQFSITLTQIITPKLVASLGVESIVDEGFLNNPYRQYRFLDATETRGFSYALEQYPGTRNSDAVALRGLYYLPWHASVKGEYRRFADSWGIEADSVEFGYTHPWKHGLTFEAKLRHYKQDQADFYSDLFAFQGSQNFLARDKELSTFTSNTIGIGVSYELPNKLWGLAEKSTVNLFWDRIAFDYDNFRDVTATGFNPGEEPLYSFDADVIRLFLSVWY